MIEQSPELKSIVAHALDLRSPLLRARYLAEACRRRRGPARRGRQPPLGTRGGRPLRGEPALSDDVGRRPPEPRGSGVGHRPLQAAPGDRRGRDGRRLHGRADAPDPPQGRPEDHQAGDGLAPGVRPVRGRASGARADGPPEHSKGSRRRVHGRGPPVLRHGAGQGTTRSPSTATRPS